MTRAIDPAAYATARLPDAADETSAAFQVEERDRGRRLDVVVAERMPMLSRSRAGRLAEAGLVLVDDAPRKPAFRLRAGQHVRVRVPPSEPARLVPEAMPLEIVYEDDDLLVVDKPPGLTVHPAPGHPSGTLVNAVLARVPDLPGSAGTLRPGIVHRLDKDTSGLLVIAKTELAQRGLAAQLQAHTVRRTYLAIVRGRVRQARGTISAPVGRHPADRTRIAVVRHGRPAVTHYEVLERLDDATLLACRLETGRTHQIRVHLTHIGHPILGDPVYGRVRAPGIHRQALHAAQLEFAHPRTGRPVVCAAPPPEDFSRLLACLRRNQGRAVSGGDGRGGRPAGD